MNDHLLYLASTGIVAFTCLLVSGLLLSLKTLRESTIPKYRTACKYLALASALVGIGHIFILSSGTDERTIMELFYFPILLISASQALLFTFLLTLLFRGKNVTRRNILLHAMPTIALTVAYTIACLFREDVHTYRFDVWWDNIGNPPLLIRTLTCLVYLVQLGGYTHFFFRERAIYLGNLKQIPQSPERLELRWVTRAFLWALGIGIAAVSLCFFPNNYYNTAVNFVFALFYASVSIHYANYHYTYDQLYLRLNLAPQADADTDPNRMDLEDLIGGLLEIEEDELFQQAQNYMASSLTLPQPEFQPARPGTCPRYQREVSLHLHQGQAEHHAQGIHRPLPGEPRPYRAVDAGRQPEHGRDRCRRGLHQLPHLLAYLPENTGSHPRPIPAAGAIMSIFPRSVLFFPGFVLSFLPRTPFFAGSNHLIKEYHGRTNHSQHRLVR